MCMYPTEGGDASAKWQRSVVVVRAEGLGDEVVAVGREDETRCCGQLWKSVNRMEDTFQAPSLGREGLRDGCEGGEEAE
jgi:hypothetical protein